MKKILQSEVRIRFQDCDPFNHLNNAKYLDYFINTREDQIEQHYGIDVFKHMKTTGESWAIGSNQIQYFRPAGTMEKVIIESQLISFSEKQLLVEMRMLDKDHNELKALLWTRFIPFNVHSQKRSTHSSEMMDLFKIVCVPLNENFFEERISNLLSARS